MRTRWTNKKLRHGPQSPRTRGAPPWRHLQNASELALRGFGLLRHGPSMAAKTEGTTMKKPRNKWAILFYAIAVFAFLDEGVWRTFIDFGAVQISPPPPKGA